ncbi:MAG TPA: aldehyde dehydrogenase family protein [Pyrinomonadaceae bacterium]|jgi:acyl-CoA reductase-like NAD-dependent aldehyde dehydrogenase|nr:aldehyde dehydrogenase family protein [Pyrinomonadaceae bacterium]
MLHVPILRRGEPYRSLDVARAVHYRTREPFVEVSQANVGLIRRDLRGQAEARAALARFTVEELLAMCARAAEHFAGDELPLGDSAQTPEDYVRQVTATTGMPHVLVRRNLEKIRGVLNTMGDVLRGLTRGLDLKVLDEGFGEQDGQVLSFYPVAQALGIVLPSNSPAVHALWTPAVALKTPLVLKPGASEPWTPYRLIEAFARAGVPREAFGYYPTDHAGAGVILEQTGRGMMFGDVSSVGAWKDDPRVELHGPGYSKIVIGEDCADEWERHLDVIAASIADNGGRSCVNASGVWVTRHAEQIAEALAERLSRIVPRAEDDPEALLAPFADPSVAERIDNMVEGALSEPGARDLTAARRGADRLARREGCAYLLPTVVLCETPEHPLANREFLFPFASVVEVRQEEMPAALGPTLVVTAITEDAALVRRLAQSPLVGRLNVGPVATNFVRWDQPHEGNLFEHLYARRAFHRAAAG